MSNDKKTSIDVLWNAIPDETKLNMTVEVYKTVLRIHEQEITDAHTTGYIIGKANKDIYEPEQYYKETFGGIG